MTKPIDDTHIGNETIIKSQNTGILNIAGSVANEVVISGPAADTEVHEEVVVSSATPIDVDLLSQLKKSTESVLPFVNEETIVESIDNLNIDSLTADNIVTQEEVEKFIQPDSTVQEKTQEERAKEHRARIERQAMLDAARDKVEQSRGVLPEAIKNDPYIDAEVPLTTIGNAARVTAGFTTELFTPASEIPADVEMYHIDRFRAESTVDKTVDVKDHLVGVEVVDRKEFDTLLTSELTKKMNDALSEFAVDTEVAIDNVPSTDTGSVFAEVEGNDQSEIQEVPVIITEDMTEKPNNLTDEFVQVDMVDDIHFEEPRSPLTVPLNTPEEIDPVINSYVPESTESQEVINQYLEKLADPTDYRHYLTYGRNMQLTNEQMFKNESLKDAVDNKHTLSRTVRMGDKPYSNDLIKLDLNKYNDGDVIKGNQALKFVLSLNHGVRRVYLYSSGFWVLIRPALLSELNNYYFQCQRATYEFGREFGQFSYIPFDVRVRKIGIELFKNLIIDSNLQNWNVGDTFEKSLSKLDYKVCLWAIASLMFQNGTDVDFVCHTKECRHVERVKVDVSKMCINDYTRIGKEALMFVYSPEKKTPEMLKKYHEDILKDRAVLDLKDNWKAYVGVPSFFDDQADGEEYIAEMTAEIQITNERNVAQYVNARYYRAFSPFVINVSYTDPNTGKVLIVKNKEAIPDVLNGLQLQSVGFADAVLDFIKHSETSHICYIYDKCPKCGSVPSIAHNNLIACDVQQSFFILTGMKLQQS